jgi:hypothetical protein
MQLPLGQRKGLHSSQHQQYTVHRVHIAALAQWRKQRVVPKLMHMSQGADGLTTTRRPIMQDPVGAASHMHAVRTALRK